MIRLATPDDDLDVGELQVAAYESQYARKLPFIVMPPNRLADLRSQSEMRQHGTLLVYEQDGRIVGTVALFPFGSPRSEAWIGGAATLRYLAVAASHHGQGLSHDLMNEVEHQARTWNVPGICLHVRRECEGVARLYKARGYVRDTGGDQDRRPQVFLEGYALRFSD